MAFSTLTQFMEMGGHGVYVWSAYGIWAVTVVVLAVRSVQCHQRSIEKIRKMTEVENYE